MNFGIGLVLWSASFGSPPERSPRDPWFGRDKLYHLVGSAVLQGAGHALGRAAGLDYREAAWTAAGVTFGIGLTKEWYDRSAGRFFSWRDVAADAGGIGVGAVLVRQLDK